MGSDLAWQCGACGTLIEGPETRTCPTCHGINFYPLADEVPGDGEGERSTVLDTERALERLKALRDTE